MRKPLSPMALYIRLAEASADLARQLSSLSPDEPLTLLLEAAWVRLDDLIEELPAALVWDAQRQAPPGEALAARVWARQAPSARWQELPPPQNLDPEVRRGDAP